MTRHGHNYHGSCRKSLGRFVSETPTLSSREVTDLGGDDVPTLSPARVQDLRIAVHGASLVPPPNTPLARIHGLTRLIRKL